MKNLLKCSLLSALVGFGLLLLHSCRTDFEPSLSTGNLEFSRDTIFLDTVFSNIGSSTYSFKVYNRSNELISIPQVRLAQGENSQYRLNIDGIPGKIFENVELPAKDSIYVFVETTVDASQQDENQFLYTDQILFDSGVYEQQVALVTLIQDAIFLYPERNAQGIKETLTLGTDEDGNPITIEGFILEEDQLVWTNQKPYVIYGYAGVAGEQTLRIEAGARIHFHENSGIILSNGARLEADGSLSQDPDRLEGEIILEGDRLEPEFSAVPGQWGTLWFTPGSTARMQHVTIKNNAIGILAEGHSNTNTHDHYFKNVQIYNTASVGLYGVNASILGENLVIGNSGISNFWARQGGSYEFVHSTFANYWNQSFRNTPSVQLANFLETEDELLIADLTKAQFTNCIIYGNATREIGLEAVDAATFQYNFSNSLVRFEDPFDDFVANPLYQFSNQTLYTDILLNEDPNFENTSLNNYKINTPSAARALGNESGAIQVPTDLLGIAREEHIDSGAYQATDNEN